MSISRSILSLGIGAGVLVGFLSGCHTMSESHSPGTTTSYQTKNSEGETVHRSVRTIDRGNYIGAPAEPMPIHQPEPQPLKPEYAMSSGPTQGQVSNSSRSSTGAGFNGSLDLAWTSGHFHLGGHAGISLSEWFMFRFGLSAFASKDLYLGGDLSTRFHAPLGFIRPFVGAGVYFGDSKKCSNEYISSTGTYIEVCDKKFLTAGYGEAGVEFGHVSIFVRDYRLSRAGLSVPTDMFWGVGLRF